MILALDGDTTDGLMVKTRDQELGKLLYEARMAPF